MREGRLFAAPHPSRLKTLKPDVPPAPHTRTHTQFPLFGVEAARWTWSFDFQSQYVGAGFIVTGPVAYSVMVGALAAWALLFPLLNLRAGEWYPAGGLAVILGGRYVERWEPCNCVPPLPSQTTDTQLDKQVKGK